jgi:GNAT superfamily N-acetyltransferase
VPGRHSANRRSNMIVTVEPDAFPEHFVHFQATVRHMFPILGFSPKEVERFIRSNSEIYEDTVFTVELGQGRSVLSRRCEGWDVVYLIPSHWPERYEILGQALPEIQAEYLRANPASRHFYRIDEPAPSHGAYFAGLLPGLGFELEPRVRMTAPQEILEQVTAPELPAGLREIRFTAARLSEFLDLYLRAHSVHQEAWSSARRARFAEATRLELVDAAERDDRVQTWFGIECEGALVGSCFGSTFRDKLFIDELAILPHYYGAGIGSYLMLCCLQSLRDQFAKPDSYFVLDCYRTYERALNLYRRVGFSPAQFYTDATFWPEPGLQ